jgi:hypothetical protein
MHSDCCAPHAPIDHVMRPRRRPKSRPARQTDVASKTSLKDRLLIFAYIGGPIAVVLLCVHLVTTREQSFSIDSAVARWKHEYQLSDEQANRLKKMEFEFHGGGDPFLRPAHSLEETRTHHQKMADVVRPELRERFLHDLTKK